MSIIKILNTFIVPIEENSEAIEDPHDLYLQAVRWSEDVDELADRVVGYCQAHPVLDAAFELLMRQEDELDRLPNDPRVQGKRVSDPPIQPGDYKYTILNTMDASSFGNASPSQKTAAVNQNSRPVPTLNRPKLILQAFHQLIFCCD